MVDKNEKAKQRGWLRGLQYGSGLVGAILIALWLTAWLHGTIMSRQDLNRFEAARAHLIEVTKLKADTEAGDTKPVDTSLWASGRVAGYQESLFEEFDAPLAVLRIERLNIEVPVLPGTDDVTLNRGVGWIEGTAKPGSNGNFAVAGHRDGFFRSLKDIELGDSIVIETVDRVHTYVTDDLTVVDPSDVSVLEPREAPTVTLVTCYPFFFVGNAPQRFIVHATLRTGGMPEGEQGG